MASRISVLLGKSMFSSPAEPDEQKCLQIIVEMLVIVETEGSLLMNQIADSWSLVEDPGILQITENRRFLKIC